MMKWSIAGLMVLGVVAALAAMVLVSSLLADAQTGERTQQPDEIEVLVARRALPAMTIVHSEHVEVKAVPVEEAPGVHLANPVQAVGKVLARPVVAGEALKPGTFVADGSGAQLATALPEGKRAVTVAVSNASGLAGLVYPGSVVDVIASLEPTGTSGAKEAISITLLEGVQVLAIQDRTIVSKQDPEPSNDDGELRARGQLLVTLMVDSKQAKTLQLATNYGTVSLAMRNPMDEGASDGGMVAMGDVARRLVRGGAGSSPEARAALEAALQQDEPPAPPAEPSAPAPVWETTILRGMQVERIEFPLPDPES